MAGKGEYSSAHKQSPSHSACPVRNLPARLPFGGDFEKRRIARLSVNCSAVDYYEAPAGMKQVLVSNGIWKQWHKIGLPDENANASAPFYIRRAQQSCEQSLLRPIFWLHLFVRMPSDALW